MHGQYILLLLSSGEHRFLWFTIIFGGRGGGVFSEITSLDEAVKVMTGRSGGSLREKKG